VKVAIRHTINLGDFLNAFPVLSGLSKYTNEKIDLVVRGEMKRFNGFKKFIEYQDCIGGVIFDDEYIIMNYDGIQLSSITREDKEDNHRPTETCRYENWVNDNYRMLFEVDDEFELKVPDLNIPIADGNYVGDRWTGALIDGRRASGTLSHLANVNFLDYNRTLMENAYIIKHCDKPFISAFTGTAVMADLLNVDQIVLWTDDLRMWDNKPIEQTFQKHFYGNRKSKLMYLGDFEENGL
jgi:hypothetical protein